MFGSPASAKGVVLSDHALAVERLRWNERYRPKVPRAQRICRLCVRAVEDETHALFECEGDAELTRMRSELWAAVDKEQPQIRRRLRVAEDALPAILQEQSLHGLLAKFTHQVLQLYEAVPMRVPEGAAVV
ncbi:hypothetical protein CERSUDRAFT_95679 [Gelatoporia subvermispora B]|uniref:Reverse transcriptase zinc-binding domain-containing protein n=1 Tax=Ceriporiopsis subvermispora (strain B) TaxID=914234 RepID=M2RC41_CERS8|nr:hypothetical protein CERSUDRAFT_95679 [Gelatoporia subvermispora B]